MLLRFENGEPYATGAAPYAYHPATDRETSPRIILTISIDGFTTSAFVDTGGIFVISPEVARVLKLDPTDGLPAPRLGWRGSWLDGVFHRVSLTLLAYEGNSLTIEAAAFIPSASEQEWPGDFPCILGMSNCFERLRFAVDPTNDIFYFGELG